MYSLEFHAATCDLMAMAQSEHILTANRLRDGEVVYWNDGAWVTTLPEAQVFADTSSAESALKEAARAVADRLVVAPYLFEIRRNGGEIRPVKEREIIRAAGPTVRNDLGKQARHVPL